MLALKLSLTPILILLASLAGRRWGETLGGWIVGLPLTLGLRVLPSPKARRTVAALPAWDLPARMLVTTTLVVSVTAAAAALGPRLSGLLATFPIFAAVLTLFAHHIQGADAAHQVLRGLLLGLYGFAIFFIVLSQLLPRVSIAAAFVGAGLAAMLVQGVSFRMMRWGRSG